MSVGFTCANVEENLGTLCPKHTGLCRTQGDPREPVRNTAKLGRFLKQYNRLEKRIKDYKITIGRLTKEQQAGHHKPGSMNRRKG